MFLYRYIYRERYILHCIHRLLIKYFCKSFTLTMTQYIKYVVYNIWLNRNATNYIQHWQQCCIEVFILLPVHQVY